MSEVLEFGQIVLVVSVTLLLALVCSQYSNRFGVPAAVVLLLGAAVASALAPRLGTTVSIHDVTRIGAIAVIVILFDAGMALGWRSMRTSIGETLGLGVFGAFVTAGVMAAAAHYVLGFDWTPAVVIGTAVSATDPAVTFSVLGDNKLGSRTSLILLGEAGWNDPVAVALMIGVLDAISHPGHSHGIVAIDVTQQLLIGAVIGVAGAVITGRVLRFVAPPRDRLDPITALAAAGVIYGLAAVLNGSGFLAVFIAGLILGDRTTKHGDEVRTFHSQLSTVAELVVFVALGLTVSLKALDLGTVIPDGIALAAILILIARPITVAMVLARTRLHRNEKATIGWLGPRGAVPILLAAFVVDQHVPQAHTIYGLIFVIVTTTVLIQGSTIQRLAQRVR